MPQFFEAVSAFRLACFAQILEQQPNFLGILQVIRSAGGVGLVSQASARSVLHIKKYFGYFDVSKGELAEGRVGDLLC